MEDRGACIRGFCTNASLSIVQLFVDSPKLPSISLIAVCLAQYLTNVIIIKPSQHPRENGWC